MKKYFLRTLLGLIIIMTFSSCDTAADPPMSRGGKYDFSSVDRFIEENAGVYKNGVAVLVMRDGELIYGKENRMSIYTKRAIASSSKWLSGAVIMSLVDDNKISLDDTLGKYLPIFSQYNKGSITIRQLFSHTSGFPGNSSRDTLHGYEYRKDLTLAQAVDSIAAHVDLIHEPGTTFNYGECSMQIAGRIAEIVSGKSWQSLFDEAIAKPCGMDINYVFASAQNPMIGGGVRTSADDYIKFLEMIANKGVYSGNRVLSENSIIEMLSDQTKNSNIEWAPYISNPYSPNPDAPVKYGIGNWRDVIDSTGSLQECSSPGLLGTHPWVDVKHNVAGIIFTLTEPKLSNLTSLKIREMIRNIIDDATEEK